MPPRFPRIPKRFILLCGASVIAWCFALCSHSASHRGAICAHSLTSKLVASFRLIIWWRGGSWCSVFIHRRKHEHGGKQYRGRVCREERHQAGADLSSTHLFCVFTYTYAPFMRFLAFKKPWKPSIFKAFLFFALKTMHAFFVGAWTSVLIGAV